ncbi:ATP-binding protein [Brevibacillus panacihumi]|uniref:ATP-binding protein n=1 Tax=Brevibacillus panacihumi TaxID=497735 RepID=UPI003D06705E
MTVTAPQTNAAACILRDPCRTSTDPTVCTRLCPHFIAVHGASGTGGRVAAAAIPADYRQVTVANSVARAEQAKAYAIVDAYVATFDRMFSDGPDADRIKSLYLYSREPGTGKTTTAAAIANTYLVRHYIGSLQRNRRPLERPVYFLDVNEWQTLFNRITLSVGDGAKKSVSDEFQRRMDNAMYAPFAVIDDVGVRSATEAFRSYMHAVINHRVTNRLPTVYTSNVPIEELAQVFDARLADRVWDQCAVVPFVGESKRGMRR